jgi:hypothetical protein
MEGPTVGGRPSGRYEPLGKPDWIGLGAGGQRANGSDGRSGTRTRTSASPLPSPSLIVPRLTAPSPRWIMAEELPAVPRVWVSVKVATDPLRRTGASERLTGKPALFRSGIRISSMWLDESFPLPRVRNRPSIDRLADSADGRSACEMMTTFS